MKDDIVKNITYADAHLLLNIGANSFNTFRRYYRKKRSFAPTENYKQF